MVKGKERGFEKEEGIFQENEEVERGRERNF